MSITINFKFHNKGIHFLCKYANHFNNCNNLPQMLLCYYLSRLKWYHVYLGRILPSYILTEPSRAVQKLQEVLVQSATQFSLVHPYLSYHLGSPYNFSQLMKNLKSRDTFATVTTLRSALWLCFSSKWCLSSECS